MVSKNSMPAAVFCSVSSLESNENPILDRNIISSKSKNKMDSSGTFVKSKNSEYKTKWGSMKDKSEKPGHLDPIPSNSISSMESSTQSDGKQAKL